MGLHLSITCVARFELIAADCRTLMKIDAVLIGQVGFDLPLIRNYLLHATVPVATAL